MNTKARFEELLYAIMAPLALWVLAEVVAAWWPSCEWVRWVAWAAIALWVALLAGLSVYLRHVRARLRALGCNWDEMMDSERSLIQELTNPWWGSMGVYDSLHETTSGDKPGGCNANERW